MRGDNPYINVQANRGKDKLFDRNAYHAEICPPVTYYRLLPCFYVANSQNSKCDAKINLDEFERKYSDVCYPLKV